MSVEEVAVRRVDADVHITVPSVRVLLPYLSSYWQEELRNTAFNGAPLEVYPASLPISTRPGARLSDSGLAATEPSVVLEQAVEEAGVDVAILNCTYAVDSICNPDGCAAFASAVNDWQINEWFERDGRFRGSLLVPPRDPELAAAEIARVGVHPGFVQVLLPARSRDLYGQRCYHPLFAAAVEHGLAVSIQFGGFSGNAPTGVGWPTYYIEEYVGMAPVMQSQLLSIISEGVFERFADLRMSIVDGGFTWLPSFMWRFDKDWRSIRREVPWTRRPPSEYIREHVRFTTSQVDGPAESPQVLTELLSQMWDGELLLYASDYPHKQFDAHDEALSAALPVEEKEGVLGANAVEFYRLN